MRWESKNEIFLKLFFFIFKEDMCMWNIQFHMTKIVILFALVFYQEMHVQGHMYARQELYHKVTYLNCIYFETECH